MAEKMHYFSPMPGRAFRRPGSDQFIGASRTPKGFVINPEAVVAISDTEMMPFRKDYNQAVRLGDLKRRTKKEYEAWQQLRTRRSEKKAAERKKQAKEAEKKTKVDEALAPEVDSGSEASAED